MAASEGYADFRGHRTWYSVAGELGSGATPLLALHGGPGSRITTCPLGGLSPERPVVPYDQIGCGSSDRPQDIEWSVDVFREGRRGAMQLGLDRIHLLRTSWGGMLALEHVLSGADGIVGLILSSTLASVDQWAAEQLRLRNALPADVVEVFECHERAGTYHDPEYDQAMEAYFDRHFYRGQKPRAELEAMNAGKAVGVYNGGDPRVDKPGSLSWAGYTPGEIDVPTLVIEAVTT
jgi:L-proline amide hydrolase